jgi:outer membrane protein assembly factor BamB
MPLTLDDLKYTMEHSSSVGEKDLGKPVALVNYASAGERSMLEMSGMNIAMMPNGSIIAKSNPDDKVHAIAPHATSGFQLQWSFHSGYATAQRLAIGSDSDILFKAYGREMDGNASPVSVILGNIHGIPSGAASAGTLKWRHDMVLGKDISSEFIRQPVITNDRVYVMIDSPPDSHSTLCAFDLTTGHVAWQKEYPGKGCGELLWNQDKHLYTNYRRMGNGDDEYGIMELSPEDGSILATFNQSRNFVSNLSPGSHGDLYALSGTPDQKNKLSKCRLVRFERKNGQFEQHELFVFPEDEYCPVERVIVGQDETLYVSTVGLTDNAGHTSRLYALTRTGEILWEHPIIGMVSAAPTLTEEGTLYIPSLRDITARGKEWLSTGDISAINLKDGSLVWKTSIQNIQVFYGEAAMENLQGRSLFTKIFLAKDGMIYVGAELGEASSTGNEDNPPSHSCLIALRAHEQLASGAPWPMEYGNEGCSGVSPLWPL